MKDEDFSNGVQGGTEKRMEDYKKMMNNNRSVGLFLLFFPVGISSVDAENKIDLMKCYHHPDDILFSLFLLRFALQH